MVSEITGVGVAVILALLDSWQAKEPPLLDAAALFSFFYLFTFLYLNAIDIWHTPSEIRHRFFARFIDFSCKGFCREFASRRTLRELSL